MAASLSIFAGLEGWDALVGFYFSYITLPTIGYGDYSPQTSAGRVITAVAMCAGLCFTAMPLAIVGNTFTRVWEERQQVKLRGILRQMLTEQGISPTDFTQASPACSTGLRRATRRCRLL